MGLLYEKERRTAKTGQEVKVMPDIKEAESLKRVPAVAVPLADDEDEWEDEMEGLLENAEVVDELGTEEAEDDSL